MTSKASKAEGLTKLDANELQRLRALCEAATPGPWMPNGNPEHSNSVYRAGTENPCSYIETHPCIAHLDDQEYIENPNCTADAAFIAAAREALPALLEELEEEKKTSAELRSEVETAHAMIETKRAVIEKLAAERDTLAAQLAKVEARLEEKCEALQDEVRDHSCTALELSALKREIAEAPVVYGRHSDGRYWSETRDDDDFPDYSLPDTHRARLVRIEPIDGKKEE